MEFFRTSYICKDQIAKPLPGEDKGGTRELLSRVKDRRNIALMVDQKLTEGIIAKLFNKDCYTTRIPAQFAKKYNYKLVPISLKRVDKYFFEMNILDEIDFSKEDTELQITNRINNVIEKMIKENPGQWIWTHKKDGRYNSEFNKIFPALAGAVLGSGKLHPTAPSLVLGH